MRLESVIARVMGVGVRYGYKTLARGGDGGEVSKVLLRGGDGGEVNMGIELQRLLVEWKGSSVSQGCYVFVARLVLTCPWSVGTVIVHRCLPLLYRGSYIFPNNACGFTFFPCRYERSTKLP